MPLLFQAGYFCGPYSAAVTDTVSIEALDSIYKRYIAATGVRHARAAEFTDSVLLLSCACCTKYAAGPGATAWLRLPGHMFPGVFLRERLLDGSVPCGDL